MLVQSKQILKMIRGAMFVTGFNFPTGSSANVTAALTTTALTAGHNSTPVPLQVGVEATNTPGFITSGSNRVEVYDANGFKLSDSNGNEVFGRLTFVAGAYNLSLASMVGSTETPFVVSPAAAINFAPQYLYTFEQLPSNFATGGAATYIGNDPKEGLLAAEYGEAHLPANVSFPTSNAASQTKELLSFTLPSAGVWEIELFLRSTVSQSGAYFGGYLNDSSNALVPNSRFTAIAIVDGTTLNYQATSSNIVRITTSGAATFKYMASVLGDTNVSGVFGANDPNGHTKVLWKKLAGFVPVTDPLAAEYGETLLPSSFTIPASNVTEQTVNVLTFTLPSAGVWEVESIFRSQTQQSGGSVTSFLTDAGNVLVTGSNATSTYVVASPLTTIRYQGTVTNVVRITTTGPATYKLRAVARNNAAPSSVFGDGSPEGGTKVVWKKISGFMPLTVPAAPLVSAKCNTTLSLGANFALKTVIYNNVISDSGSIYNTATGQFKPTVAGWYQVNATADVYSGAGIESTLGFYFNGAMHDCNAGMGLVKAAVSAIFYFNGTSDYLTVVASSFAATSRSQGDFSRFSAVWLRA